MRYSRASNRPPSDPPPLPCLDYAHLRTGITQPWAGPRLSTGCQVTPWICSLSALLYGVISSFPTSPNQHPPTLFHSFLSSHNSGREQLVGLKGLTGSKIPFSKIVHHPTSVPFLGCGIHLQGAMVLLGAQRPGPVNRSRAESVLDGFQQTCHKWPSWFMAHPSVSSTHLNSSLYFTVTFKCCPTYSKDCDRVSGESSGRADHQMVPL